MSAGSRRSAWPEAGQAAPGTASQGEAGASRHPGGLWALRSLPRAAGPEHRRVDPGAQALAGSAFEDSAPQLGWPALTTFPSRGLASLPVGLVVGGSDPAWLLTTPPGVEAPVFTSLNHRGEKSGRKHLPGI